MGRNRLETKAERIARARLLYEDMVPKREIQRITGIDGSVLKIALRDMPSIRQRKKEAAVSRVFSEDDLKTILTRISHGETIKAIAKDYKISPRRLSLVVSAKRLLIQEYSNE